MPTPVLPVFSPTQGTWLYRASRRIGAISLRLFYRRIEVAGTEHVPPTGPVLLAANHPNHIVDALVIAAAGERPVQFIAKGPLLDRYPLMSRFMRGIGAIPVFRKDDPRPQQGHRRSANRIAFDRCSEALATGTALGIFVEGESHAEPQVRDLQTGTARVLLEAEARHNYTLGVALIPVGLYFPTQDQLFSDGAILFGTPIDTVPYLEQHRTDPRGAIRALTAALAERLRMLTLHLPDVGWIEFVEQMTRLTMPSEDSRSPVAALQQRQTVAAAAERFRRLQPEEAEQFRRELAAFWMRVEARRRHAPPPQPETGFVRTLPHRGLRRRLADAAALPLGIAGFAYNTLPYLVPQLWSHWRVQRREKRAFVKFLIGVPTFALWYFGTARWMARRSQTGAMLLPLLGIGSGLLALRLRAHRQRWLSAWRDRGDATEIAILVGERGALMARFQPWLASIEPDAWTTPDSVRPAQRP